jgi:hypothetical protein
MQGYIILACDDNKYRDMAINLARSLRVFDPCRPVCLIHDNKIDITEECRRLFHDFVLIEKNPEFVGVMNKVRLYDLTPYDQTMYLDADMLLMRPNMFAYWELLNGQYFNMTGDKCVTGHWYSRDVAEIVRKFKLPYMVMMNSGVFYFEKSIRAKRVFDRAIELFRLYKEELSAIHRGRPGQFADEPIFGVVMGEQRLEPVQTIEGHGSWMVTTWQTRRHVFDPEHGVCYFQMSSTGYPFRQQWLSRGWVNHSPNFVHFVKLLPRREYQEAVAWFQQRLQSEAPAIRLDKAVGG